MAQHRLWGLDLLRAAAILAVLILHSQSFFFLPPWAGFGWAGVDLFFVLSGYLVGRQGLRMEPSAREVKNFWLRRWTRTFPLYFLVLAVYVGLKPAAGFPFQADPGPYFFFLQNYFSPGDFVQSWSLCIEEQFYLVLPLLILVLPARSPAALWLLPAFFSLAWRWHLYQAGAAGSVAQAAYGIQFPTHTHLDGISIGVFLAATERHWAPLSLMSKRLAAASGIGMILASVAWGDPGIVGHSAVWMFTVFSLAFALLLPWAITMRRPGWGGGAVEKIALWSYGIYLWNNLIFRLAEKLALPGWQQGALAWAATIFVSAITFRYVESLGLRWRGVFLRG